MLTADTSEADLKARRELRRHKDDANLSVRRSIDRRPGWLAFGVGRSYGRQRHMDASQVLGVSDGPPTVSLPPC